MSAYWSEELRLWALDLLKDKPGAERNMLLLNPFDWPSIYAFLRESNVTEFEAIFWLATRYEIGMDEAHQRFAELCATCPGTWQQAFHLIWWLEPSNVLLPPLPERPSKKRFDPGRLEVKIRLDIGR